MIPHDTMEFHDTKQQDFDHMRALGEVRGTHDDAASEQASFEEFSEFQTQSVSELFQGKIIQRAPDKMISYYQSFVLLAFRNTLVYISVEDQSIDEVDQSDDVIVVNVESSQFDFLNLSELFKIICIHDVGNLICTVVLEDLQTRQIRFLSV